MEVIDKINGMLSTTEGQDFYNKVVNGSRISNAFFVIVSIVTLIICFNLLKKYKVKFDDDITECSGSDFLIYIVLWVSAIVSIIILVCGGFDLFMWYFQPEFKFIQALM